MRANKFICKFCNKEVPIFEKHNSLCDCGALYKITFDANNNIIIDLISKTEPLDNIPDIPDDMLPTAGESEMPNE